MTIYTRDEAEGYKILERERKRQGKSLQQVASGIYSPAMLRRIETGKRLPGKLERDRIMARLGIPKSGAVEYLPYKEYRAWQMRQEIVQSVEQRDAENLERLLAEFEKQTGHKKLENQFLEVARYMLLMMQGTPKQVLQKTIEKAANYTISDIEEALAGRIILDAKEEFMLQEYACLREKENSICTDVELRKGTPVHSMKRFCELYREPECYCINEVIKERRKSLGISRRQLAEGICSEKTIERLENCGTTAQRYVVKRLFERLGIDDKMLNRRN